MIGWLQQTLHDILDRGGWVMYPLAALSLVGVTLIFERAWFFLRTNGPGRLGLLSHVGEYLRDGRREQALATLTSDRSVYADLVRRLVANGPSDAVATVAIEHQRPRLERFMPTLGTIITAAPMLGILGTVVGIIGAFDLLGETQGPATSNLEAISKEIAEALLTTVAGLIVALVVLFPYNAYRAQIERTLGRMEMLIAAAQHGAAHSDAARSPQPPRSPNDP